MWRFVLDYEIGIRGFGTGYCVGWVRFVVLGNFEGWMGKAFKMATKCARCSFK